MRNLWSTIVLKPAPIYTVENCTLAYQCNWGASVFWRTPIEDDCWLRDLTQASEPDGIRILHHRFTKPGASQFFVSSTPTVSPEKLIGRVKGRLQYAVRERLPKALKRNYAVQSIGSARRDQVERYIESQLSRYQPLDERLLNLLRQVHICCPDVDLSQNRQTTRGILIYNLHLVLETDQGWAETRETYLRRIGEMIRGVARARGHLLSRTAILPDHLHIAIGGPMDVAPADIALCYMNNLAFVYGMQAVYRFSAYVGTFGEYDVGVVQPKQKEWEHRLP